MLSRTLIPLFSLGKNSPNFLKNRKLQSWRRLTTVSKEETLSNSKLLKDLAYKIEENVEVADNIAAVLPARIGKELSSAMEKLNMLNNQVEAPSTRALWLVAVNNAIPFIGFGFMDNAIMITAGEAIDLKFGVIFGMSTMAAAAWGNLISDLSGLWLGGVVERIAQKLGLPSPNLSRAQLDLPQTRRAANVGCMLGVTFGCILGMAPLLYLDTHISQREKEGEQEIITLFDAVRDEVGRILNCQASLLYLVDHEKDAIFTKQSNLLTMEEQRLALGSSKITGQVAHTGIPIQTPPGEDFPSVLCMPAFDSLGNVIAVLEVTGKLDSQGKVVRFNDADEQTLSLLCSHLSTTLEFLRASGKASIQVKEAIRLIKDNDHSDFLGNDKALLSFRSKLSVASHRVIKPADISLMFAAEKGDVDQIKKFISQGGYVNVRDGLSRTPLHLAAAGGHTEAVKLLMSNGANPFIVDQSIVNPLQVARQHGKSEVAEVLKSFMVLKRRMTINQVKAHNLEITGELKKT